MTFLSATRDLLMADDRDSGTAVSPMGEDEFRLFYERTARPLWSYLARVSGDATHADDYLQEAYYRIYRSATRYESESHRRNALFHIATNLMRDAARHGKRHEQVALDDAQTLDAATVSELPTPERHAAARTDLSRAMLKIEPVQRELLWLAYAQGASHDEIAAILGLKPISIRTLLLRARRKLATILTGNANNGVEAGR
jgi:RNA polymerase sigma-70 factor (ECF subfamily)